MFENCLVLCRRTPPPPDTHIGVGSGNPRRSFLLEKLTSFGFCTLTLSWFAACFLSVPSEYPTSLYPLILGPLLMLPSSLFFSLKTLYQRDFIHSHGFVINKLMTSKPLALSWTFNQQATGQPLKPRIPHAEPSTTPSNFAAPPGFSESINGSSINSLSYSET